MTGGRGKRLLTEGKKGGDFKKGRERGGGKEKERRWIDRGRNEKEVTGGRDRECDRGREGGEGLPDG